MSSFIGAWRLISFEERYPDGSSAYPYGSDPVGILMYDASGRMSVQIMRRDRPNLSGDPQHASPDEIKSAVEGFTAFFGSYEIDEARQVVIHHVEGHLLPNSVGKNLERRFEVSGDRLILRPSDNRTIVWQRV
jgi:hypothetical protein